MSSRSSSQLNIRSTAARAQAQRLAAQTGKTVTQIVEEAVQAYRPPLPTADVLPAGLVRKGRFLVFTCADGPVSLEQTNVAIDEDRHGDPFAG